jgi:hypothetical protein
MHPNYEDTLLEKFEKEFSQNCVLFKALGHFDIIVIYKGTKRMLFTGALPGIRSFSNIDCVSWDQDGQEDVIEALKKYRVIALNVIALHSDAVKNYGGIRSKIFNEIDQPVLHLNSLSWGEQVIILQDYEMKNLISRFQSKIHPHVASFLDVHSILGINMEEVRNIDSDRSDWEEEINTEQVGLKWFIDLESINNAEKKVQDALNNLKSKAPDQYCFSIPEKSFSMRTLVYELKMKKWKHAINAIRDVRTQAVEAFSSTKLQIRIQEEPPIYEVGDSPPERYSPEGLETKITIDANTCHNILINMGNDVARQVLESVYTILDTASNSPSIYAIESLIPATIKLINNSSELKDVYLRDNSIGLTILSENERKRTYLMDAERLLTATRQRLAGMPITREFSRLPFELPPPGLRIYYEAAEYVAATFLSQVMNDTKPPPYVLIDTVDGPQYGGFAIVLPHRQMLVPRMYEAITHESLHHFIQKEKFWQENIMASLDAINFYKAGRILSNSDHAGTPLGRYKMIEDIVVESIDFIFSYLEDIDLYMKEEWTFFVKVFDQSIKTLISPEILLPYILRTLAVKIQYKARYIDDNNSSMDRLISLPRNLRLIIREHLREINDIIEFADENLKDNFPPELVVNLQHDIEEMAPLLLCIHSEINKIKASKKDVLERMGKYWEQEVDSIVDQIKGNTVVCQAIPYPHLVINRLSSKINEENITNQNEIETMAKALIMSLWNASQLHKCEKSKKENEQ